ncbi:MAG: DUF3656 domain-containing protein [Methanomicrobiales archaeon]|nr:DUF3656 domain-containing protein [Methanomicrobiales archaeon]
MKPLPRDLPELLAPAGSMEALKAAVTCGADAVYLGGKRFSARQYAANFDDRELGEAVDLAHARGVRTYVAVNTLLHDGELRDAAEYLIFLRETGVDAVLVQDPGLASLAREVIPGLPLHASTQMTIHGRAGLAWAASLGISRVVLARELPLAEVVAMGEDARRLGIGLEIFAHGALCYSYSGQCLLSSAIGGRSGNRGRCAQPCRRPYALVRGGSDEYGRPRRLAAVPLGDRYLLSTRDLCLYPYLDRVVRAPVVALKIEGRMRSPEYVGTVTGIYRRALDAIAAGTWAPSPADEETLALTFNRGFTGGCLCEGPGGIMGRDAPGHRGVLAGVVQVVDPETGSIGIMLTGPIVPEKGDGLVFRGPADQEADRGMILRQKPVMDAGILWLRGARAAGGEGTGKVGSRAFITRRARLARGDCSSGDGTDRRKSRIRVDLRLRIPDGGRPVLEGSILRKGVPVTVIREEAGFIAEPARARELTGREVQEILSRRAGSPYDIGEVSVEWPGGFHARKGDIGRLRRDLLSAVERYLAGSAWPAPGEGARARELLAASPGSIPAREIREGRQALCILTDTLDGVQGIAEEGSGTIALEPTQEPGSPAGTAFIGDVEGIYRTVREAAAMTRGTGWSLLWKWPRITGDGWIDALTRVGGEGEEAHPGLMVETVDAAVAARQLFPKVPVHGGPGLNAWNARAVQALAPLLRSVILSPELSLGDLTALLPRIGALAHPPRAGFIVQGNLELMVSEDRLSRLLPKEPLRARGPRFTGIRDGTSRVFPVQEDACGRTRILNPVETCLIDQLPALSSLGIDLLVIDARGRGPRYGREMAAIYRQALSLVQAGGNGVEGGLGDLRDRCRERARGGITRGPFLRGLREE